MRLRLVQVVKPPARSTSPAAAFLRVAEAPNDKHKLALESRVHAANRNNPSLWLSPLTFERRALHSRASSPLTAANVCMDHWHRGRAWTQKPAFGPRPRSADLFTQPAWGAEQADVGPKASNDLTLSSSRIDQDQHALCRPAPEPHLMSDQLMCVDVPASIQTGLDAVKYFCDREAMQGKSGLFVLCNYRRADPMVYNPCEPLRCALLPSPGRNNQTQLWSMCSSLAVHTICG
jgi:hypothetical protein